MSLFYPQVTHSITRNATGERVTIGTGTYLLAGGNNITLSQDGNTVTISNDPPAFQFYQNMEGGNSQSAAYVLKLLSFVPIDIGENIFQGRMTANTLLLNVSGLTGAVSNTGAVTETISIGIYTIYSSTNLSLINSATSSWGRTANANNTQSYVGPRWFSVHSSQFSASLTFSQTNYIMGILWNNGDTASRRNLAAIGQSYFGTNSRSGTLGVASTSDSSLGHGLPFFGIYSATTTGLPSTVPYSAIFKIGAIAGVTIPGVTPHLMLNNLAATL